MKQYIVFLACAFALALCEGQATGQLIDLELRVQSETVAVGEFVEVELWAIPTEEGIEINSAQTILIWDPVSLQLTGCTNPGVSNWNPMFRMGDSFGLNEANPPVDGDALWIGEASLGRTVPLDVAGTQLATFVFEALLDSVSQVEILMEYQLSGKPKARTKVNVGTFNRVGNLGDPVEITIGEVCGDMDANDDGFVDLADFAEFQICFDDGEGTASPECLEVFDGDCDGDVDLDDYVIFDEVITGPVEEDETS